jgi:hypothetical protein
MRLRRRAYAALTGLYACTGHEALLLTAVQVIELLSEHRSFAFGANKDVPDPHDGVATLADLLVMVRLARGARCLRLNCPLGPAVHEPGDESAKRSLADTACGAILLFLGVHQHERVPQGGLGVGCVRIVHTMLIVLQGLSAESCSRLMRIMASLAEAEGFEQNAEALREVAAVVEGLMYTLQYQFEGE